MRRSILILNLLLLFIVSCRQAQKDVSDANVEIKPAIFTDQPIVIPLDSSPVVNHYPVLKPLIIKAGIPKITNAFNNIHPAGEPVVLKEEIPQKIIPGNDGFDLPDTIDFDFKKVPCLNRPARKALKPGFVEHSDFNLQYLDVEQGLPTGELLSLFKDSRGNVWMGTNGEGVIKYDGSYFTQYTTSEGLLDNWVRCILEDEKGNIWFGTDEGLVKYDGYEFTWVVEKEKTNLRMDIRSMVLDKMSNIWFGTFDAGLFKFDGKSLTRYNENQGLGNTIYGLKEDRNGNLWIGANFKAVYRYDGKIFEMYKENAMISGGRINCIEEDRDGNIWIGTAAGLSKFNGHFFSNYTEEQGLPFNHINCIQLDNAGNLWIGTEGGGACKFDGKNFYYYSKNEGFRSNQIEKIIQDKSGILWFASLGAGIMKLNEKGFTHFSSIPELNQSVINTIYEDKKGNIWFGTQSGDLIKFNGESFYTYTQKEGFNGTQVRDILQDKKGNIWIAILYGGLCKFDGTSFTYYNNQYGKLLEGALCLYEDSKGNIWVGLRRMGVIKYDGDSFTHFKLSKGYLYEDIMSIMEDSKENMWFTSMQGLVTKFDGKSFTFYNEGPNRRGGFFKILEDSMGNIWMTGRDGAGLIKYNGIEFYQFTTKQGLTDNKIRSLVQDKGGNFWIGTKSGLNYFENPLGKTGVSSRITPFGSADGLFGINFQENAALIDSKGNAWWGTNKAVNKLDLRFINPDTTTPVMNLNAITVSDLNVDFHHLSDVTIDSSLPAAFKQIKYSGTEKFLNYPINPVIPFKLNYLRFYFNAIDWASPGKLKYRFKVDGLDDKWSDLSEETFVNYRNIPYGNYIFKVKAIGAANKWSNTFEYAFTIDPPWWHTWRFRSIVVLVLLLSIYGYTRNRTRSLLERQKYLQLTVDKRTDQLRVSLTEKEILLKEIHHRVKNNLEVISSLLMLQTKTITDEKAKAALTEGQSRVQSIALIHHNLYKTDEMGSVELCGFAKDLFRQVKDVFNKPGTQIEFQINEKEIWLDTDAAVPFGLILNELFTNTFKYAVEPNRENNIVISLEETTAGDKTDFTLVFRDNGRGMPAGLNMEESTSLGMKVIQLLTRQLDGNSRFYNDNGTIFELHFAKKNNSLHA